MVTRADLRSPEDIIKQSLGVTVNDPNNDGNIDDVYGGRVTEYDTTPVRVSGAETPYPLPQDTRYVSDHVVEGDQHVGRGTGQNFPLTGSLAYFSQGTIQTARDLIGRSTDNLAQYLEEVNQYKAHSNNPGAAVHADNALRAAEKAGLANAVAPEIKAGARQFASGVMNQVLNQDLGSPTSRKQATELYASAARTLSSLDQTAQPIKLGDKVVAASLGEAHVRMQEHLLDAGRSPKEVYAFAMQVARSTGQEVQLAKRVQDETNFATAAPK